MNPSSLRIAHNYRSCWALPSPSDTSTLIGNLCVIHYMLQIVSNSDVSLRLGNAQQLRDKDIISMIVLHSSSNRVFTQRLSKSRIFYGIYFLRLCDTALQNKTTNVQVIQSCENFLELITMAESMRRALY